MAMRKNWINKICMMAVCVVLAGLLMPQTAHAINPLEVGAEVSLTMDCHSEAEDFPEVEFKIYKVGEINEFGELVPVGRFAEYPVEYAQSDASGWKMLADTLAGFVAEDENSGMMEAFDSNVTDATGKLVFPNNAESMTTGWYLVTGDTYTYNNAKYEPQVTLICLPNRLENDEWDYAPEINVKSDFVGEFTEIYVAKVWDDEDDKNKKRPDEIEVELLKDGEVYETIKLNDTDGWDYTWTDLEPAEWTVAEKTKIEGYTVLIDQEDNNFTIENTYKDSNPSGPTVKPNKKLPQTGMLWWPVPLLAGTGMLCFMIGWAKRQKSED